MTSRQPEEQSLGHKTSSEVVDIGYSNRRIQEAQRKLSQAITPVIVASQRFPLCDPAEEHDRDKDYTLQTSKRARQRRTAKLVEQASRLWDWYDKESTDPAKQDVPKEVENIPDPEEQSSHDESNTGPSSPVRRQPNVTKQASTSREPLHEKIENIWKWLETPYETQLDMLEVYSRTKDPETLIRNIDEWESLAQLIAIREKMEQVQLAHSPSSVDLCTICSVLARLPKAVFLYLQH